MLALWRRYLSLAGVFCSETWVTFASNLNFSRGILKIDASFLFSHFLRYNNVRLTISHISFLVQQLQLLKVTNSTIKTEFSLQAELTANILMLAVSYTCKLVCQKKTGLSNWFVKLVCLSLHVQTGLSNHSTN